MFQTHSSSGFSHCNPCLINLDVSNGCYCFFSLNARGSQKVWYKAWTYLKAVHRPLASLGRTVWKCRLSGFIYVAMICCRQGDVMFYFRLLFSMKWCLQYVVRTKGVNIRKAVRKGEKIELWSRTSWLNIRSAVGCVSVNIGKTKPFSCIFFQKFNMVVIWFIWFCHSILYVWLEFLAEALKCLIFWTCLCNLLAEVLSSCVYQLNIFKYKFTIAQVFFTRLSSPSHFVHS